MKPGDQVRYREMIARVVCVGGGRLLIEIFAGAPNGGARYRWVKERQVVRDLTRWG